MPPGLFELDDIQAKERTSEQVMTDISLELRHRHCYEFKFHMGMYFLVAMRKSGIFPFLRLGYCDKSICNVPVCQWCHCDSSDRSERYLYCVRMAKECKTSFKTSL